VVDRVKALERDVVKFDQSKLRRFSSWFTEYEVSLWDQKIERDFAAGNLDFLIEEAKAEREASPTRMSAAIR
jgi:hypothetical protein